MDAFSGFFNWLQFHYNQVFFFFFPRPCRPYLLFVPEEEELYLFEMFFFFSVNLCSFSVLWNNVAVFQFNVSLPHCIKFVQFVFSFY